MPHLSKEKLNTKTEKNIDEFLTLLFQQMSKSGDAKLILDSILTPTERLMIAKRMFVIFLLVNNEGYYKIWEKLKVSSSTVHRYQKGLENGEFDDLLRYVPKTSGNHRKDYENSFFDLLFDFLTSARNTKRLHQIRDKYGY